jgi:opacity protein-like surface antigen
MKIITLNLKIASFLTSTVVFKIDSRYRQFKTGEKMKKSLVLATLLATSSMYAQSAIDISKEEINNKGKWYIGFGQASGSGTSVLSVNGSQVGDDIDISPKVTTFKIGKVNGNADKMELVYTKSKLNSGTTENIGIGYDAIITFQSLRTNNLVPYWSGGLEYIKNSDASLSGLGARVGLGLFYNIDNHFELNLGYKFNSYLLTSTIDSDVEVISTYNTMGFGLNYKF